MPPKLANLILQRLELARLGCHRHLGPPGPDPVEAELSKAFQRAGRLGELASGAKPPRGNAVIDLKLGDVGQAPIAEFTHDQGLVAPPTRITVRAPQPGRPFGEVRDQIAPANRLV